jgi:hypothetical protein
MAKTSKSSPVRSPCVGSVRLAWGLVTLVPALALTACSDGAVPEPRAVAIQACEQMAVAQYDLSTVGQTQVREVENAEGDSFEVTGESEGTAWVCTWSSTRTDNGTKTETTIDTR